MLTVHFQVGASRLLRTLQLQSSYHEILDSLSADALPDLLIFIHSIHTPVRAYKLQIDQQVHEYWSSVLGSQLPQTRQLQTRPTDAPRPVGQKARPGSQLRVSRC